MNSCHSPFKNENARCLIFRLAVVAFVQLYAFAPLRAQEMQDKSVFPYKGPFSARHAQPGLGAHWAHMYDTHFICTIQTQQPDEEQIDRGCADPSTAREGPAESVKRSSECLSNEQKN